jgi:hypothetical protein
MKNLSNKKLLVSLGIGVFGMFLVIQNFLFLQYRYEETPVGFIQKIYFSLVEVYYSLISQSMISMMVLVTVGEFGFLIPFFLSPFGIFLAVKSLNSPQRKLAIFAIILNSINLIFALFIAWLLFGLARGM